MVVVRERRVLYFIGTLHRFPVVTHEAALEGSWVLIDGDGAEELSKYVIRAGYKFVGPNFINPESPVD